MKKKTPKGPFFLQLGIMVTVGVIWGMLMGTYVDTQALQFPGAFGGLMLNLTVIILMYAAIMVQVIIHEAGHLVFGLLSGYRFCSFRIFSWMLVKEGDKLKLKKFRIPGTAGQCLMGPPELKDGKMPTVLYNLGGPLMNVLASLIFLGAFFALRSLPWLSMVALCLSMCGIYGALTNGIPMRTQAVSNDGYHALSLRKNPRGIRSLWIQLKQNELLAQGLTYRKMPPEWFQVPTDEQMTDPMEAVLGVMAAGRLMEERRFEEAEELMSHLLSINTAMAGVHCWLMTCDRIYVELITQNRREEVDRLLTADQKKVMKNMKTFLTVLRTEYAYALLYENDPVKAGKLEAAFQKQVKTYPYPQDAAVEAGFLELARQKARERENAG